MYVIYCRCREFCLRLIVFQKPARVALVEKCQGTSTDGPTLNNSCFLKAADFDSQKSGLLYI